MSEEKLNLRSFMALLLLLAGICALVLASAGCSRRAVGGGEWISEISVDGNVKTVRTVDGSVWGGTATLVEEASIGQADGPEEYLLGSVRSVYAHDGRLFVLDAQVPIVRVYDYDGNHRQDIGGKGSGPGEFVRPWSLVISPVDGTIYIRDGRSGRLNVYEPDGISRESWPIRAGITTSRQMVMTHSGEVYSSVWANTTGGFENWRTGMARMESNGATEDTLIAPDYDFEPWELTAVSPDGDGIHVAEVPFAPSVSWTMSPTGMMIGGVSTDYRLGIYHADGGITAIERDWDPVRVDPDEAGWLRRRLMSELRMTQPGWAWRGRGIPGYKPPFDSILADRSRRIWVRRQGAGALLPGCIPEPEDRTEFSTNPCWRDSFFFDVFDEDGRFLGDVEIPEGFQRSPVPFIEDDLVLAVVEGEDGTPYVKRYRLVIPGN